MKKPIPFRTKMMPDAWYQTLDPGIRFAVRVLHAAGIETCQSCQGGADPKRPDRGHAYEVPTVDMPSSGDDAVGFQALAACVAFGMAVRDIQIVWNIRNGLPHERLWRITFWNSMEAWKDRKPNFIYGAQAQ